MTFFIQDIMVIHRVTSFRDKSTAANSGFKKLAVQWLNKHLCFVSFVLLADNFVLRNRQFLKPANRYRQP
jgi:hypothetical protein